MQTFQNDLNMQETSSMSELDQVLGYHHGDANAAIITLLADCQYLRSQLTIAQCTMSVGFTRGWRPSLYRD